MKIKKYLSLYIHIPFCKFKCRYCDFLSFANEEETQVCYVEALCKEIQSALIPVDDYKVQSIFFGGGTPSVIDESLIARIMDAINKKFHILEDAEISIEANPGTLSKEKLAAYKSMGFNRLSLGLQSANDEELKVLGRIHTYDQFLDNYKNAKEIGFTNINIDLMSALPDQTMESYMDTLHKIIQLNPAHISAYSLIIEEGTPFYENDSILSALPTAEIERDMYYATKELLNDYGYFRYEISNYAKAGKECRHNCVYWTGQEYLGFGLGASSYFDKTRFSNSSNMKEYLKNPATFFSNKEDYHIVTEQEAMEEYMFLGLRMTNGISIEGFYDKFKKNLDEIYGKIIIKHKEQGLLDVLDGNLRFTSLGLDVSNYILSDFILDE